MELNRLTRDADDLIRKVVSRYNQLYTPASSISQVELDLLLDDLRKLYDTFKTIGQVNLTLQRGTHKQEVLVNTHLPDEEDDKPAPTESEKAIQNPAAASTSSQLQPNADPEIVTEVETEPAFVDEAEFEPIATEPEIIEIPTVVPPSYARVQENPAIRTTAIPEAETPIRETAETQTPVSSTGMATGTLADKFNTGNKSLSETIAPSQDERNISSRLLFHPIADLATGIGLNDKFSFRAELFANDAVRYDEAITRINKAVNLDEANWILQKYHSPDWDSRHETLTRLKDFIKRRFI